MDQIQKLALHEELTLGPLSSELAPLIKGEQNGKYES